MREQGLSPRGKKKLAGGGGFPLLSLQVQEASQWRSYVSTLRELCPGCLWEMGFPVDPPRCGVTGTLIPYGEGRAYWVSPVVGGGGKH